MADEVKKDESTVKEIDVKGYKFMVDTDLLDDVDSLEFIDRIENKGHTAVVLPLLKHIMGQADFDKLKAHFITADGEAITYPAVFVAYPDANGNSHTEYIATALSS